MLSIHRTGYTTTSSPLSQPDSTVARNVIRHAVVRIRHNNNIGILLMAAGLHVMRSGIWLCNYTTFSSQYRNCPWSDRRPPVLSSSYIWGRGATVTDFLTKCLSSTRILLPGSCAREIPRYLGYAGSYSTSFCPLEQHDHHPDDAPQGQFQREHLQPLPTP